MLVHICCSVDSHYFLQCLKKDYPNETIVGFFYDPNIHPYSEYQLRLLDVQYSCEKLGIKLIVGDYDFQSWLNTVKGFENEPEKGNRCTICFDKRLKETAKVATKLKHKSFTTTLLISPLKSQEKLRLIGSHLSSEYKLKFVFKDYRSGQGSHLQAQEVKQNSIYRQNYCGCMFALKKQREEQNKFCDELLSPVAKQILPNSIQEKLELYKKRNDLEKLNQSYKFIKQRFLNYRLLNAKVIVNKTVIPSYFICYSTLQNKKATGKIEYCINNTHYLNRNEVKFITLKTFNTLNKTNYKNIFDLLYAPLSFNNELKFRKNLLNNPYDLSCLIVLENIPTSKIQILCNSEIYEDTKENINY